MWKIGHEQTQNKELLLPLLLHCYNCACTWFTLLFRFVFGGESKKGFEYGVYTC